MNVITPLVTELVAIGIGVNCAAHPDNIDYPAADLAGLGALVGPDALLQELARAMQKRLEQWKGGLGFSATRTDWLRRAAGLGETLHVRLPERELSGRFQGLDDAGRLLLDRAGRVTPVTAGEVFGFGER